MCKLLLRTLDPSSSRSLPTPYLAHPPLLPPPHITSRTRPRTTVPQRTCCLLVGTSTKTAVRVVRGYQIREVLRGGGEGWEWGVGCVCVCVCAHEVNGERDGSELPFSPSLQLLLSPFLHTRFGPCSGARAQHPPVCARGQCGKQKGTKQTDCLDLGDAHFLGGFFEERNGGVGQNLLFRDNFSGPSDPPLVLTVLSKFTRLNHFAFTHLPPSDSGGDHLGVSEKSRASERNFALLLPFHPAPRAVTWRIPSPNPLRFPCHLSHS